MKRSVLSALFAVALVQAAHADWRYGAEPDKMTGKTINWANLESNNSLDLKFPYNGKNYGSLYVRRSPKSGLNVMVSVDKGQILCNQFMSCVITVKFDSAPPVTFNGVGPSDHSSDTVFLHNEAKFFAAAKKAKVILVAITMYQAGEQILEFHTSTPLDMK